MIGRKEVGVPQSICCQRRPAAYQGGASALGTTTLAGTVLLLEAPLPAFPAPPDAFGGPGRPCMVSVALQRPSEASGRPLTSLLVFGKNQNLALKAPDGGGSTQLGGQRSTVLALGSTGPGSPLEETTSVGLKDEPDLRLHDIHIIHGFFALFYSFFAHFVPCFTPRRAPILLAEAYKSYLKLTK